MSTPFVVLGALGTLGGAVLLVLAFRRGQEGDRDAERTWFRGAVGVLALGSLALLGAVVTAGA